MFYSVANVLRLRNIKNGYSQKHLLMADSDKNVCDKWLDLLVFPRNVVIILLYIYIYKCIYGHLQTKLKP